MSLPLPNLDDRTFQQLLDEATQHVARYAPDWTDLSPSDPGTVLLEAFAYLTETMIYRLNRLPQKAYLAFLNLLGVSIHPPAAASVMLQFSVTAPTKQPIVIPRGTRVTIGRTADEDPPIFTTTTAGTIGVGTSSVSLLAHHCDQIEAELLGVGDGLPAQRFTVQQPPLIATTGNELDLIVGVALRGDEPDDQTAKIQHDGKPYRIWRAVDNFSNLGSYRFVYLVDRAAGTITFAPAARLTDGTGALAETAQALAATPAAGCEIRVWYRRGGGRAGNVAANMLTTLKTPLAGVSVTNLAPATGGESAESLENALIRGPQELHSLQRAVTARDFEVVAESNSRAVARAKAFTRAALWKHATPGTVELLLVPKLPQATWQDGNISLTALRNHETAAVHTQIQQTINERRPLGTSCIVSWANYKKVQVNARIVVGREEDPAAVEKRVLARLHQTISPIPTRFSQHGWPFGAALRASDVYNIALAEAGVRWVDQVSLLVEEVPDRQIKTLAADFFQTGTWYAGSRQTLFRSLNNGVGWEPIASFDEGDISIIEPHPLRAGIVAVAVHLADESGARLYFSHDCGESWRSGSQLAFQVRDLAWVMRGNVSILLMATDRGLYELPIRRGGTPIELIVDQNNQERGIYAVATRQHMQGSSVAVAFQHSSGIYLSSDGGRSGSFRPIGQRNVDVRKLAVQYDGPRAFLWAGITADGGDDPGKGCLRWELRGDADPPEGWQAYTKGWQGGSCRDIAFHGRDVLAATHRAGVVRLTSQIASWQSSDVRSGLPMRDTNRFNPVETLGVDPQERYVLAGGAEGIYRSTDGSVSYTEASNKRFVEKVTLPAMWLFVSGEHQIKVVSEDEAIDD